MLWPHGAALLEPGEIPGGIAASDQILGNAAVSELPGRWLDLHRMGARPGIDDLAGGVGADLFLLEVAETAGGFEKGAGLARDVRKDRNISPILPWPVSRDRPHGVEEPRQPRASPARDVVVLGVVALDQDALAGAACLRLACCRRR